MAVISTQFKDLAQVIGWELITEDKGFSTYEFEIEESKFEHIAYIVRILDDPNELEMVEILLTLTKVLPFKLRCKVNKLIDKLKMENLTNTIELIGFTIEEYKKQTPFSKLREYGALLGVNIESLGYKFEYRLKRRRRAEILSQIEISLPMELAPVLGKIKKLDYKIAYIKNRKRRMNENE